MLAMIDDFEFDVHKTSLDDIESKIDYSFATHQNLAGFDTYQNTGKYEEQITLKGTLICKSQKQLDAFEKITAYGNSKGDEAMFSLADEVFRF